MSIDKGQSIYDKPILWNTDQKQNKTKTFHISTYRSPAHSTKFKMQIRENFV